MTKHYSQKDNLISIMTEISKKTPRGILNGDTQVGHITWQMYLMRDYLKLDGTPLANASNDYSDLLSFAQDNNLITADTTDNSLFKYNSTTDVLTLPNYMDLVLQGGNTVEEKEAGLPNIKGAFYPRGLNNADAAGATVVADPASEGNYLFDSEKLSGERGEGVATNSSFDFRRIKFDASKANSIYSDSVDTVQPPAITLIPQIKYRKATTMYEQIDAVVNYSTTEKVVGTWIDGKPLYQKTYECNITVTANNWVNTNIAVPTNISNIITSFAGDDTDSMNYISFSINYPTDGYIGIFNNKSSNVVVKYFNLQYTKTTD